MTVYRAVVMPTSEWRRDARMLRSWSGDNVQHPEEMRCRQLAMLGERLGLDVVGMVVETRESDDEQ
jgi:hypothetical protein